MSRSAASQSPSEVRSYVKRLLVFIFVGIVLMATTATWAWNTYGKKLESAPPLPTGVPPIDTSEQSTR